MLKYLGSYQFSTQADTDFGAASSELP
jgi:hypothetical protein